MQIHSAKVRLTLPVVIFITSILVCLFTSCRKNATPISSGGVSEQSKNETPAVRFATFNVALNRTNEGDLVKELETGQSQKAKLIAEVIQRIRPDVLLLNEFDYDKKGQALDLFARKYLGVGQNGCEPIRYDHSFSGPVNTGVDSQIDMNGNGKTGEAEDAFGYGQFPGQYGMAVLSNLEFDRSQVKTFQQFRWRDMPNAMLPVNEDGTAFYPAEVLEQFRLSSKSHWVVPVRVGMENVCFICAHPTPPVFDGPEDRNGKRNHDEIRLLADIISNADYLIDDRGRTGGLTSDQKFVVAGDLNADPTDGASFNKAVNQLLKHELINSSSVPASDGAKQAAEATGKANESHRGDHGHDTGDFNDASTGNLRADYVLPSKNLNLLACGVFWPASSEENAHLNEASDHHLVWIDVSLVEQIDR